MMASLHRHCVGGKLLDKHGTVEPSRVTCPRDTTSVLEGRERSQPYRTRTRSRVDHYTINLTLASEQHGQSPSRLTHVALAALRLAAARTGGGTTGSGTVGVPGFPLGHDFGSSQQIHTSPLRA